jgi:integrase
MGIQAINNHLTAVKSLSRWLFRTERMRTNPLMQVAKLNAKTDRLHVRRALSDEELTRLISVASDGPAWIWREGNSKDGEEYCLETLTITGPDRAMLYRLAAETGLRAGELASLTPASFDLVDLDVATVKVQAAYSKHRRDDLVPLRADFAQAVAIFIEGRPRSVRLFNVPSRTADMLKADLLRARRAWLEEAKTPQERKTREDSSFASSTDGSGHVVDFHALRHTFITRLARSGVTPAVAKSLARHSTITLTMDHYTHTLIGDERAALNMLPAITTTGTPCPESVRATGTYDVQAEPPALRVAPVIARRALQGGTGANTWGA